ncbi:3-hydroxyacyl-CoA dehydrogenase family protein [Rhodococcus opacus]|nr:3-hydroxyacyl-CoA dehydrogenase family protein [Rhodococcus opacus]
MGTTRQQCQHSPPPLLQRMVDAGRLSKKTGQGFYSYT